MYRDSKKQREELKKAHSLGFRKPIHRHKQKPNTITSRELGELSDTDYNTLLKLLTKLPKTKTVSLPRTSNKTFARIVGHELTNELLKLQPDLTIIHLLSAHLPEKNQIYRKNKIKST